MLFSLFGGGFITTFNFFFVAIFFVPFKIHLWFLLLQFNLMSDVYFRKNKLINIFCVKNIYFIFALYILFLFCLLKIC